MIGQMARGMGRMMIANIGTEVLYSFVIIVCSLMIYFGTKELYELSQHKGIKYFRLAFLFFALAYFFRSFIKFIVLSFDASEALNISPLLINPLIGPVSLFFFIYLSTMAILYLLYSVMWKKWNGNHGAIYLLQFISLAIAFLIVLSQNAVLYLLLNLGLFLVVLFVVYISQKGSTGQHRPKMYATYVLLSFFLILNMIDILLPSFLQTIQIVVYLFSTFIFLLMLYKVLKKAGS